MRILIDTNIFIYREYHQLLPDNFQKLLQLINKSKSEVLVHPKSVEEISNDPNEERRKVVLTKLKTYPILPSPPACGSDSEFKQKIGAKENPIVDDELLYSVYRNAVDFFITEDSEIRKKAAKLEISDRVFSIDEALFTFTELVADKTVKHPIALKDDYVYNLDINDAFFQSLKEDYEEFEKDWFPKICKEGRKCWVYHGENGRIGALLVPKIEEGELPLKGNLLPKKKRLKICLLKVDETGHKIGELFIKQSVELAMKNNADEIYLTHFTKKEDHLIPLISEYGFEHIGYKERKNGRLEEVYLKDLSAPTSKLLLLPPIVISKKYWPKFYDGDKVKKFVVPIQPQYHNRFFVGSKIRTTLLSEHAGQFVVEGNTIKKAYLCNSQITKIEVGDLLLFYRSEDARAITSIGVVERINKNLKNPVEIAKIVGKRTVYSMKELQKMVTSPVLVILFTWQYDFPKPIPYPILLKNRILAGPPISISEIRHESYLKLKQIGGIDGRYPVD